MKPWIRSLFGTRQVSTIENQPKIQRSRRFSILRAEQLEDRLAPASLNPALACPEPGTAFPLGLYFLTGTISTPFTDKDTNASITSLPTTGDHYIQAAGPVTVGITEPKTSAAPFVPLLTVSNGVTLHVINGVLSTFTAGGTVSAIVPPPPTTPTANTNIPLLSGSSLEFNVANLLGSSANSPDGRPAGISAPGTYFPNTATLGFFSPTVVTPAAMGSNGDAFIQTGDLLTIDSGQANQETVTVKAVQTRNFTATFTQTHGSGFTISDTFTTTANQVVDKTALPTVVTPVAMGSNGVAFIRVGDQLTIDSGLANQETVTVTAVQSNNFTATFTQTHGGGFTIADTFTTTANQAIAKTTFDTMNIVGPPGTPVIDLFSGTNGIQTSSTNSVELSSYSGPLSVSNAPTIPLPTSDYVQISNAGPVIIGPTSGSWTYSAPASSNLNIPLSQSSFTATSFLATYDATQQRLSMTGGGLLFLQSNKVATLAAATDTGTPTLTSSVNSTATTVTAKGWDTALTLPYDIYIDNEDMTVSSVAGDELTVKRGQNGTTAASHNAGAAIFNATIRVAGWNSAVALPYEIRIGSEDLEVDAVTPSATNYALTVKRAQFGTTAVAHNTTEATPTPIYGSTQVVLGNVSSTTSVVTPGFIVTNNSNLTQFYLTVQDSNLITLPSNVSITPSGLQFSYYQSLISGVTHNFYAFTGGASLLFNSQTKTTNGAIANPAIGFVDKLEGVAGDEFFGAGVSEIPYSNSLDATTPFPKSFPFLVKIDNEILQVNNLVVKDKQYLVLNAPTSATHTNGATVLLYNAPVTFKLALGSIGTATPGFLFEDDHLVNANAAVSESGGVPRLGNLGINSPTLGFGYANGGIQSIKVTNGGNGYTSPPTVTFVGKGAGAAGTAVLSNGSVIGVIITTTGSGYGSDTTVVFGASPNVSDTNATALGTVNTGDGFSFSGSATLELPTRTLGTLIVPAESLSSSATTIEISRDTASHLPSVPFNILVGYDGVYEEMTVTAVTAPVIKNGRFSSTLTVKRGIGSDKQAFAFRRIAGAPSDPLYFEATPAVGGKMYYDLSNITVSECLYATAAVGFAYSGDAITSASLMVTGNTGFTVSGVTFNVQGLGVSYTAPDTFGVYFAGSMLWAVGTQQENISVSLGSATAPGLVITNGSVYSLNAAVTADFNFKGLQIAVNALTFTYNKAADYYTLDGGVSISFFGKPTPTATVPSNTYDIKPTDLKITYSPDARSKLPKAYPFLITIDSEIMKVTDVEDFGTFGYLKVIRGYDGTVAASHLANAVISTYQSVNSFNLSATFGDTATGGTDHGIVIADGVFQSLYLVASGGFSLHGLSLQANAVTIVYSKANDDLELSGGVSVILTNKFGFAANISNSTPLSINTATGDFSIPNGLNIAGNVHIGTYIDAAVTVVYIPDGSSYDLSVTGQVSIASKFTVFGAFSIVAGELNSIALSYSNTVGVPIADTGLFLTELGGEVDNINNPSQLRVLGSLSIYGLGSETINGNHIITASGGFTVDANHLDLNGNVTFASGLGTGNANIDINWFTGIYSVTGDLSLFDGIVDVNASLTFDKKGDITLLAMGDVNVPNGVPFIGGDRLASLNFLLYVRPNEPLSHSFISAWTTVTIPEVNIGGTVIVPASNFVLGFEYTLDNQLSLTSGPPPQAANVASAPETLTVGNDPGDYTLYAAIAQANSYNAPTTIQFASSVSGNIAVGAPLSITTAQPVTIVGPGAGVLSIDGQNSYRVISIGAGATVEISGLSIKGGYADNGGGISNAGTLQLNNDIISNNQATANGGGIYNTGKLTLSNVNIHNNTAGQHGGGIENTKILTMYSSVVDQNTVYAGSVSGTGQGIDNATSGTQTLSQSVVGFNGYIVNAQNTPSVNPIPSGSDIEGRVEANSSNNIIACGSGMTGITNNDTNNNQVGGDGHSAPPMNISLYTVTTSTDSNPDSGGSGSAQSGDLRYCITQAGLFTFPTTIQFSPKLDGVAIKVSPMHPLIIGSTPGSNVTLIGDGKIVIDGGFQTQIFRVGAGSTALLTGLNIFNAGVGVADAGTASLGSTFGGGIHNDGTLTLAHDNFLNDTATVGGAVYNTGSLTANYCTFSNNKTAGSGGYAGGIFNTGILTISNSRISSNTTQFSGGGIYNLGGTVTLSTSTVSDNVGSYGGGIYSGGSGTLTVSNSTLSGNSAHFDGGGIYSTDNSLSLTSSTLSGNSAAAYGGGIFTTSVGATVTDSTITGNTALFGGGIYNSGVATNRGGNGVSASYSPALHLISSTISSNSSPDNGFGGGIFNTGGLSIVYTIVSGNTVGLNGYYPNINLGGTIFTDQGYNLLGTDVRSADPYAPSSVIFSDAPGLGALANNGGPTKTMAVLPGSPAGANGPLRFPDRYVSDSYSNKTPTLIPIGTYGPQTGSYIQIDGEVMKVTAFDGVSTLTVIRGINGVSANISPSDRIYYLKTDQRGAFLPITPFDIGAYQSETFTVNSTGDIGTGTGLAGDLRYCVSQANLLVSLGLNISPTIVFDPSLNGQTIVLQKGPLEFVAGGGVTTINGGGSISGGAFSGGVTISGGGTSQVFMVDSGATAVLSGLTITGAGFYGTKAGGYGGIGNAGTLTLTNDSMSGNTAATYRPIIYNSNRLTVSNSIVSHNSDNSFGTIQNDGTASISDSTISYNTSAFGGGIRNAGTLTLTNSIVSNNTATSLGGGLYNSNGGTLTASNSVISANSAPSGGGIYFADGTVKSGALTLIDSTVSGNSATVAGGGIDNANTTTLSNSTVSGNSVTGNGGGVVNTGTMTLANTTVSANSATGNGGGIETSSGLLTISSSTISGNSTTVRGGGIDNGGGTLTLQDSIVAANLGGDLSGKAITDNGYNLLGTSVQTNGTDPAQGPGDIFSDTPGLVQLLSNGGTTQTMALKSTSPAIGHGGAVTKVAAVANAGTTTIIVSNAAAIAGTAGKYKILIDGEEMEVTNVNLTANTLTVTRAVNGVSASNIQVGDNIYFDFDQRGGFRPTSSPDIGAYQSQNFVVNFGTDNSAGGVGSGLMGDLRYCIAQSNANASSHIATTIQFLSSVSTVTLQHGPLEITNAITTINGGGKVKISGSNINSPLGNTTNGFLVSGLLNTKSLKAGMLVTGPGIPVGDKIAAIVDGTQIQLTSAATATQTNASLSFGLTGSFSRGFTIVTVGDTSSLTVGMPVSGYGIPAGATIAELNPMGAPGQIRLTVAATATASNVPLDFGISMLGTTRDGFVVSGLGDTSALRIGMPINGPGIPVGDTIAAIIDGSTTRLSASATQTATNVPLAFGTNGSVFLVEADAHAILNGLTISNGSAAQGGGINNAGTLTLTDDNISGNFGNNGSGIYNTGTLTLSNTILSGNFTAPRGSVLAGSGISKQAVQITWSNPADISYGTALSNSQLNATAGVAGSFAYTLADGTTPAAGAVLKPGQGQLLNVTFTPTDTTDYAIVISQVTINVFNARPVAPSNLSLSRNDNSVLISNGLTNTPAVTLQGSLATTGLSVDVYDVTTSTDMGYATVTGTSFSMPLRLITGQNQFKVTAIDIASNTSIPSVVTVTLDQTTPVGTFVPVAAVTTALVPSATLNFNKTINAETLTTDDFTLRLNGGANLITNAVTITPGVSNSFTISGLGVFETSDGTYVLSLNAAGVSDGAGNTGSGTASISWTLDTTKPTSVVNNTLSLSNAFIISGSASATDSGVNASGVVSVAVYVTMDSNPYPATPFVTLNPGNLNFTYQGMPGHHYYFRSIATDNAGNVESKNTIDASTFIAIPPPVTNVVSATPNALNATFAINVTGTDAYGPGITSFAVYVRINSGSGYGSMIFVGNVAAGSADGSGVYHATITYQASQDGITKSFQFFSVGTDTAGRVETTHTTPDVTVNNQTFAQAPIAFTGLTIQHGLLERSFIQYIDLNFNEGGVALQTLYNNIIANPGNYLQLLDRAYGASTNTQISLAGVSISLDSLDNAIEINFGPNGLGGIARGSLGLAAYWNALISGDGWYELNVDVTGRSGFASAPHGSFERLLGDTNGDGAVDDKDVNLVSLLQGSVAVGSNANGDINGDGIIDATDKYLVGKSKGRKLQNNPFI